MEVEEFTDYCDDGSDIPLTQGASSTPSECGSNSLSLSSSSSSSTRKSVGGELLAGTYISSYYSEVNKYLVAKGLLARYICSCQLAGIRTAN